jgi:RNA polymerase sigma-70 factor, ECF subfamily
MTTSYTTGISKDSDGALVAAAKLGETQAFDELVLRHRHRVLAVALRITKNREDAEDVSQESFHKAFLHLDAFQEKSQFSTWLTRIAINEAIMLLRGRRRVFEDLPENHDDDGKSGSEVFVDQSPNPEERYWRRERRQLLSKAIHRLAPKIRATIWLRDINEKSVEETAHILGTSSGAVKARVFQGRRRLYRTVNPALLWGVRTAGSGQAHRS